MVASSRPHSISGLKTAFLKRVLFFCPARSINVCMSAATLAKFNSLAAMSLGTDLGQTWDGIRPKSPNNLVGGLLWPTDIHLESHHGRPGDLLELRGRRYRR